MTTTILLISLLLINILLILDKLLNGFKLTTLFVNIWRVVWELFKSMGSIKGIILFSIVWLVLSGVGLLLAGLITNIHALTIIGTTIFLFWVGPFTPLVPFTIALALLFQRYVLRDKNVSIKIIKEAFENAKTKND